ELADGFGKSLKMRRRLARVDRVDILAPARKLRDTRVARIRIISDIVDRPAERVDFEHRLTLGAGHNAHRSVKLTAGRTLRGRRGRLGRGQFAHAPAAETCREAPTRRLRMR